MTWIVLAQTATDDPNLAPLVRRLVQGGLGFPLDSTAALLLMLLVWFVFLAAASALLQRDWAGWLRGFMDIRGHFEQLGAGLEILRRNKRPLWIVLAGAVLSWTAWSLRVWQEPTNREELEATLALYENSAAGFAASHALAAAVVPLRDWLTLGDLTPLILCACAVLFARTAVIAQHLRTRTRSVEGARLKRRVGTIWIGLIILVAYRLLVILVSPTQSPMADCLYVNTLLLPFLTLVADGLLLSWVLTEFARALLMHYDWEAEDTVVFVRAVPVCMLVCGLANLGRYLLLTAALWQAQTSTPQVWPASRWSPILWVATAVQVMGLAWFGLPAVVAVTRSGGASRPLARYVSFVRRCGGRLAGLALLAVFLNFLVLLPFYWLFAGMQLETWSLLGAASYGHYATMLVGMVMLAGTTQLAFQEIGFEHVTEPVGELIELAEPPRAPAAV